MHIFARHIIRLAVFMHVYTPIYLCYFKMWVCMLMKDAHVHIQEYLTLNNHRKRWI